RRVSARRNLGPALIRCRSLGVCSSGCIANRSRDGSPVVAMSVPHADSRDSPRFVGVPTFMRLPLATSLDGLDASIIGLPSDSGAPYRTGERFAPNAIRAMSVMLRPINPYRGGINIFERLRVADAGDAN